VRQAIRDLYGIGRRKSLLRTDGFDGKLGTATAYSRRLRRSRSRSLLLTGCQLCRHDPTVVRRFKDTNPGTSESISRFHRLHLDRPAPTLRAGTGKDKGSFTAARPIHPTQPRCITVREAARLHSFPDHFHFHPTQWHGFRQVGNSVPPSLARAVAERVIGALRASSKGDNLKCPLQTSTE
jgi:DNA (cytosine-5)-methyltransferase 1